MAVRTVLRKARRAMGMVVRHYIPDGVRCRSVVMGHCPVCERRTAFVMHGEWLRDLFRCARCECLPRERALMTTLEEFFPNWRELSMHESSPGSSSSTKLAKECRQYIGSQFWPDTPPGRVKNGYRSENLEAQTFADASFDLVITQDVFEHVLDPYSAFHEIARTLKPGGCHVFTVPWYYWKPTLVRAVREPTGGIRHLEPPDFHGNPIDASGSLVVTEWGYDLCDVIYQVSGMTTTAFRVDDLRRGIRAKFIEVFISRKSPQISAAAAWAAASVANRTAPDFCNFRAVPRPVRTLQHLPS